MREARKKVKKGDLTDSHSLALHLPSIDDRYSHLETDIINATRVIDYASIRASKMAETRQLLDFFSRDELDLNHLKQIVIEKAREAKKTDALSQERLFTSDLSKLRANFDALTKDEK